MDSWTKFCALLLILAYASCIVKVSCSNASLKENINETNAEGVTVISNSSSGLAADNQRSNESETTTPLSRPAPALFSEGGSVPPESTDKTNISVSSTKKPVEDERAPDIAKRPPVLHDPNSLWDTVGQSTEHRAPKGRKGVENITKSEELLPPLTSGIPKNNTSEEVSQKPQNNQTDFTPAVTVPSISNNTLVSSSPGAINFNNSSEHTTNEKAGINASLSNNNSSVMSKSGDVREGNTEAHPESVEDLLSPKLKPEYTRDDNTDDQSSYALTSTETDYVIPIVATIFAAPLLIMLMVFLYQRSKEFWERRHYRRMDFLIDGMYND